MPRASFRFGPTSQHEVEIQCGYFGSEKYFVDGDLILSHWSFKPAGVRRFSVHGHNIEIRLTVTLKGAHADAFVDNPLVAKDLFAEFNGRLAPHRSGPPWLVMVAAWFVVAIAIFTGLKFFDHQPHPAFKRTPHSAA